MPGILELRSTNVKRIKVVEIKPGSDPLVIIGGDNEQGKTSVIDSIAMACEGKRTIPSKPIREGESKAATEIVLDDLIITRKFTANGTSLTVTTRDGAKYSSPQKVLDELVGKLSFDPLAFSRMDKKKQGETLRELLGLDFSELDEARERRYEERTDIGRQSKFYGGQIAGTMRHQDAPSEEVSMTELVKRLDEIKAHNDQRTELATAHQKLVDRHNAAKQSINDKMEEVIELERRAAELRDEVEAKSKELKSWAPEERASKERLEAFEPKDDTEVRQRMERIEEDNRKVRDNRKFDEVIAKVEGFDKQYEAKTEEIEEIDRTKRKMIQEAEFPVEGLGFDGEGMVTYKGIPFNQCSGAEGLRVSVGMAMAMSSKLPVILIRDGSLMDGKSLNIIHEMAQAKGFQVWIERVGQGEECTVIMEDGAVRETVRPKAESVQ